MKTKQAVPRSPIKLAPVPVDRVWGGKAVEKQFGWKPPPDRTIGEWWILSFRHDHPSVIADGFFVGIPLPQLLYAHPELLGLDAEPALLIKILDSADRLSVQVHPDDRLAKEMGLDSGKTECWYYLESAPGAKIYCGLADGVDLDTFLDHAAKSPEPDDMEALLKAVPVKEGALSFIPAGTVHALGKGVLMLEVQQNSDTTFRIYDWGRPREVHIDQARRAMKAAQESSDIADDGSDAERLVHCAKFDLRRTRLRSGARDQGT